MAIEREREGRRKRETEKREGLGGVGGGMEGERERGRGGRGGERGGGRERRIVGVAVPPKQRQTAETVSTRVFMRVFMRVSMSVSMRVVKVVPALLRSSVLRC
jgi:hypothetical protein